MHVVIFSAKPHDRHFLEAANASGAHSLTFLEARLSEGTAQLADGADAVCAFVNDDVGREVIARIADTGVRLVALRSAGFNNVDRSRRSME